MCTRLGRYTRTGARRAWRFIRRKWRETKTKVKESKCYLATCLKLKLCYWSCRLKRKYAMIGSLARIDPKHRRRCVKVCAPARAVGHGAWWACRGAGRAARWGWRKLVTMMPGGDWWESAEEAEERALLGDEEGDGLDVVVVVGRQTRRMHLTDRHLRREQALMMYRVRADFLGGKLGKGGGRGGADSNQYTISSDEGTESETEDESEEEKGKTAGGAAYESQRWGAGLAPLSAPRVPSTPSGIRQLPKSFDMNQMSNLRECFDLLDQDKNQHVEEKEAQRAMRNDPRIRALLSEMAVLKPLLNPRSFDHVFDGIDDNADGKITFDEFAGYCANQLADASAAVAKDARGESNESDGGGGGGGGGGGEAGEAKGAPRGFVEGAFVRASDPDPSLAGSAQSSGTLYPDVSYMMQPQTQSTLGGAPVGRAAMERLLQSQSNKGAAAKARAAAREAANSAIPLGLSYDEWSALADFGGERVLHAASKGGSVARDAKKWAYKKYKMKDTSVVLDKRTRLTAEEEYRRYRHRNWKEKKHTEPGGFTLAADGGLVAQERLAEEKGDAIAVNALQAGWLRAFDEESGRYYFVNEESQRTTWKDPGHDATHGHV
jgi:hypothetical protein